MLSKLTYIAMSATPRPKPPALSNKANSICLSLNKFPDDNVKVMAGLSFTKRDVDLFRG